MKFFNALIVVLSFTTSVLSQQVTITNAQGNTIVAQITTNAFGGTVTQVLQTLGGAATTATAATQATQTPSTAATAATTATTAPTTSPTGTATTTTAVQGPVGQPGTTPVTPGGPTPYTYTTTDANGNTVIGTATFTPSFPATTPYTPSSTGTVLGYSQWLSMIGNNTSGLNRPVASQEANLASRTGVQLSVSLGAVLMTIVGLLGGSLVVVSL